MAGSTAAPPALAPGDLLLGRYRVVERMTEGGHSVVYLVEDERLRRPACAKILNVDGVDDRVRRVIEQHFIQEVFMLARLPHAGTVQIYDFGYLSGSSPTPDIPFQICEYLTGGPLSRWVKKKQRLSAGEALSMTLQLCSTLAEVHSAGLIHGDVKPQNVLLARTASGQVAKLADFGIAQIARDESLESRSVLMYSVNWAAPEQLVGEPLGPSADLYSLALTTIFMLSGRLVFLEPDPTDAYRRRKYAREVVANALEQMTLPADAVALLLDACSFDPRERIQNALEFGHLLEQALAPVILEVPPTSPRTGERVTLVPETPSDTSLPGRVTAADLWSLSPGRPCPPVAGRRLDFVPADPWCDLSVTENVRVRVSFVPSSSDTPGLHIMGLNCFVSIAAGRPSSAVTLDAAGSVDFLSTQGVPLARATITFGTEGIERSVITLAGSSIVVSRAECASLAAIDFGPENTCYLGYTSPSAQS